VLLTEMMNVQLRIAATGPLDKEKRERLAVSAKVLELAMKLLKEFDAPQRGGGLPFMDPFLYNATRVLIVSALSAVLSETLGFDVKVWKLKVL
jgi:hypothetical protein